MRRRRAEKRVVAPDPIFGDVLVTKLVNKIMQSGRKAKAESIVYGAIDVLKQKTGEEAIVAFRKAIENVKPLIEVRPRRIGGATYQVPFEVPEEKSVALALRWVVNSARSRHGKPMIEKLSQELLDAYNNTGSAVKKRDDVHKMAEANKAFAHYKW
ncbi:MAG TPA: 30S ribosomal protein S7 [Petrotogaceae bacterium]|jgi:small subunit ribosomal protein S7|nr:30S ribosomal protein S7 [Petrotogaceae bacterium]HNV04705.1 30S ribosomal protein S7 [Petrotogaceae bacterium]HNY37805.1 30S ribosomal protein S7 [Petrotogaceae bacterium]HOG34949.1 30S ribosomal protein S7 [Petrotogaceae bacterium]HOT30832.1 30S ribosomal protein S7 [Petrotogaceae bacterium]